MKTFPTTHDYKHTDGMDQRLRDRFRSARRQGDDVMARRCSSIIINHHHVELAKKLLSGYAFDAAVIDVTNERGCYV